MQTFKTSLPVIFIDVDGVMADFNRHLEDHHMIDAQGRPRWDDLTHDWWASIPAIPGAAAFFARMTQLAETRFLSAPTLSPACFSGKAAWVMSFLPHEGKRAIKRLIIASGVDKAVLAAPGRILIDDRAVNIDEWVAAGGIGILFTGDFAATEAAVLKALSPTPALQAKNSADKTGPNRP